jgi:hypothetical protein
VGVAPEEAVKITQIIEAAVHGDIQNTLSRLGQQPLGLLYPEAVHKGLGGLAKVAAENMADIGRTAGAEPADDLRALPKIVWLPQVLHQLGQPRQGNSMGQVRFGLEQPLEPFKAKKLELPIIPMPAKGPDGLLKLTLKGSFVLGFQAEDYGL